MSFIARHDLWTEAQRKAAAEVRERVAKDGIEIVRLSFPGVHGLLRGKAVLPESLPWAMRDGLSLTSTLLMKDSSHRAVVPVFTAGAGIGMPEVEGAADVEPAANPYLYMASQIACRRRRAARRGRQPLPGRCAQAARHARSRHDPARRLRELLPHDQTP